MKKRIILATLLMLFGCTKDTSKQNEVLVEMDNIKGFIQANELKVELPSNPTTGFQWMILDTTPEVEVVRDEYVAKPTKVPVSGGGGTQHYTFRVNQMGSYLVELTYQRPWEPDDKDQYRLTFDLSQDGNITNVNYQKVEKETGTLIVSVYKEVTGTLNGDSHDEISLFQLDDGSYEVRTYFYNQAESTNEVKKRYKSNITCRIAIQDYLESISILDYQEIRGVPLDGGCDVLKVLQDETLYSFSNEHFEGTNLSPFSKVREILKEYEKDDNLLH